MYVRGTPGAILTHMVYNTKRKLSGSGVRTGKAQNNRKLPIYMKSLVFGDVVTNSGTSMQFECTVNTPIKGATGK